MSCWIEIKFLGSRDRKIIDPKISKILRQQKKYLFDQQCLVFCRPSLQCGIKHFFHPTINPSKEKGIRTSTASAKISSLLVKVYVSEGVAVLEREDETPLTLEGAKANAPPIVVAAIKVVTPAENFMVYIVFLKDIGFL